ncbi:MAG: helix-turn-helix transcriptional regulator [Bacteroidota bacterium]
MKQPELGLKITNLRKQKGYTQEELVALCNINVRTLQRIENGEVTPRSYTIKTILSALDYDYESLQEESKTQTPEIGPLPANAVKTIHNLLTLAWVAGIFFLVVAVFEGIADYVRFEDNELLYGRWGHLTVKILALLLNSLLLYGFLISGRILKNYLMKIASVLWLFAILFFYAYDIISVFYDPLQFEIVLLAESVTLGGLGILLGVSIIKSEKILGTIAYISGGMELLIAFCFLTVFLSPVALFLFFPVIILEIVLLYKIATLVRQQIDEGNNSL